MLDRTDHLTNCHTLFVTQKISGRVSSRDYLLLVMFFIKYDGNKHSLLVTDS